MAFLIISGAALAGSATLSSPSLASFEDAMPRLEFSSSRFEPLAPLPRCHDHYATVMFGPVPAAERHSPNCSNSAWYVKEEFVAYKDSWSNGTSWRCYRWDVQPFACQAEKIEKQCQTGTCIE